MTREDLAERKCAGDRGTCARRADWLPRLVGWPETLPRERWTPDNAIGIVLDLPVCSRHQILDPAAYVTASTWGTVVAEARARRLEVPLRSSLIIEFVPIDHLDERRAQASRT